jgi:hypothetical protein
MIISKEIISARIIRDFSQNSKGLHLIGGLPLVWKLSREDLMQSYPLKAPELGE